MSWSRHAGCQVARRSRGWPARSTAFRTDAAKWSGCDGSKTCRKRKSRAGSASAKRPSRNTLPRDHGCWRIISMEHWMRMPRRQGARRAPLAAQIDMTHDHRQIERDAALWLARRDAGGWADRQQAALDAWLTANVAHRVAFLRLEAAWDETARLKTFAAGDTAARFPARGEWAQSPYFAPSHARAGRSRRAAARRPRRWPVFAGL